MSLRNNLIKLAYENPELRKDLLPLLKEFSDPESKDENKPETFYGLPPRGVQASSRFPFIDPQHLALAASLKTDHLLDLWDAARKFLKEGEAKLAELRKKREDLKDAYVEAQVLAGNPDHPDDIRGEWLDTDERKDIDFAIGYYEDIINEKENLSKLVGKLEVEVTYLADPTHWNRYMR